MLNLNNIYSSIATFWAPISEKIKDANLAEITSFEIKKLELAIKVWQIRNLDRILHFISYSNDELAKSKIINLLDEINEQYNYISRKLILNESDNLLLVKWIETLINNLNKLETIDSKLNELTNLIILSEIINTNLVSDLKNKIINIELEISEKIIKTTKPILELKKLSTNDFIEYIENISKICKCNEPTIILEILLGTRIKFSSESFINSIHSGLTASIPFEALKNLLLLLNSQENNNLLDIGSGNGTLCQILGNFIKCKITGIDINKHVINLADQSKLNNQINCEFFCDDINNIDLNNYDVLIIFSALSQVPLSKLIENLKEYKNKKIISIGYINEYLITNLDSIGWSIESNEPKNELDIAVYNTKK